MFSWETQKVANCFSTNYHANQVKDFVGKLLTSVQFSSVTQSCPTLCDPMNRSMPGLPVHHQLPEFTQTHAHRVGDAIQPSHSLSSPSPPAPNPFQHQGLLSISILLLTNLQTFLFHCHFYSCPFLFSRVPVHFIIVSPSSYQVYDTFLVFHWYSWI